MRVPITLLVLRTVHIYVYMSVTFVFVFIFMFCVCVAVAVAVAVARAASERARRAWPCSCPCNLTSLLPRRLCANVCDFVHRQNQLQLHAQQRQGEETRREERGDGGTVSGTVNRSVGGRASPIENTTVSASNASASSGVQEAVSFMF